MNRAKFIKIVKHGSNLILHLKGQWYDKIEFEGKLEEYRDYKEYWFKRLVEEGWKNTKFIPANEEQRSRLFQELENEMVPH